MNRRAWALIAAAAAVLAAAVGPPANETPAEAASHSQRPNGAVWVPDSVTAGASTWEWEHVNLWECTARICTPSTVVAEVGAGKFGDKKTSDCQNRGADAAAAGGCGGHSAGGGWAFRGHVMCYAGGDTPAHAVPSSPRTGTAMPPGCSGQTRVTGSQIAGSAQHSCPGVGTVSDTAHCGAWTACGSGNVPNAAKTSCEPCPAGQRPTNDRESCETPTCPTGQHRHGAGACEADHAHGSTGPPCPSGLTADRTVTWTYHDASGNNAAGSKICAAEDSGGGGGGGADRSACATWSRQLNAYNHGFAGMRRAAGSYTRGGARIATPMPWSARGGNQWPWQPSVIPSAGVWLSSDGTMTAANWGSDYTGEDRPGGWQDDGGRIRKVSWATSGGGLVSCSAITIANTGSGWVLGNITLADPEAATSGTGRGRRTFEGATVTDPGATARFSAYETWTVTVSMGDWGQAARLPLCTRAEAEAISYAWSQRREPITARLGLRIEWRPDGAANARAPGRRPAANPARSCSWAITVWQAVAVRELCQGAARDADGNLLFHPDGTVRCTAPGI